MEGVVATPSAPANSVYGLWRSLRQAQGRLFAEPQDDDRRGGLRVGTPNAHEVCNPSSPRPGLLDLDQAFDVGEGGDGGEAGASDGERGGG